MRHINGEAQNLGFVKFAEYAYLEVLGGKSRYEEFPMGECGKDHMYMKKFIACVMQKDVGISADADTGAAGR